ncbi:MAG TPA: GntR family transcriptional regulator [Vicinamibacteria bacterium]|nr:GntR family transcriptional regulator [Vicinamibacteria bacterium]
MEIVLNRKGGLAVRRQLVAQLELRILGGDLAPGERLPSVRALARRLRLHPNTVSAAYRQLEASRHVEMRRGAGVFVRQAGATSLEGAKDLDEMIRVALDQAERKGFTAAEVQAAVLRWLGSDPPDRLVVVDPSQAMAELALAELGAELGLRVQAQTLRDIEETPALLDGGLAVSLPYHVAALRKIAPRASILIVTLEVEASVREAIADLPKGAIALVVSHAETVLPFATTLIRSLRGDEVLVEGRVLSDVRGWKRLVAAADVVFADVLSEKAVRGARPRRLQPFRVLEPAALARVTSAAQTAAKRLTLSSSPSPRPRAVKS